MVFSDREKCRSVISTLNGFLRPLLFSPMTTVLKKNVMRLRLTRLILKHEILKSLLLYGSIGFFCTPLDLNVFLVWYNYFPMSALCTLKKKYTSFRRVLKADYYSYNIAICWITNAPTMSSPGQSKFTVIRELFLFYLLRFNDVEG